MAFVVLFTGISGSGKTTLAHRLHGYLQGKNMASHVVDGDELRERLGNLFGYTREERMKNSHVVRTVARYLQEAGIIPVVAIVAPYEEMRRELREFIGENYVEVFVDCGYEQCAERDVKGYYEKVKAGLMKNLNGADDVYEPPQNADVVVHTDRETVEESLQKIVGYLEERRYVV